MNENVSFSIPGHSLALSHAPSLRPAAALSPSEQQSNNAPVVEPRFDKGTPQTHVRIIYRIKLFSCVLRQPPYLFSSSLFSVWLALSTSSPSSTLYSLHYHRTRVQEPNAMRRKNIRQLNLYSATHSIPTQLGMMVLT